MFLSNVELYKRGDYHLIQFHDINSDTTIKLNPKQIQILNYLNASGLKHVGAGGAARGGKSLILCVWQLFQRYAYPGTRGLLGRAELTNLKITTLKTMENLLDNCGLSEDDYNHNQQNNIIYFSNGSEILLKDTKFKPSDNLGLKWGSLEITDAAIDESNETDVKIIHAISGRVGTYLNEKYQIPGKVYESFNPSKNHVNTRFWIPYRDKTETENRKFVQLLPGDNPGIEAQRWLQEKIIDYKNGDMTPSEYQRLVLGNFDYDDDPDLLIDIDSIWSLFSNDHVIPNALKRSITADIAMDGNDSFVVGVWNDRVLTKVLEMPKSGGREVIDAIKTLQQMYNIPNNRVVYDADGVGAFIGNDGGFIEGARPFKNGSRPYLVKKENFKNLKSFCAFKFAKRAKNREIYLYALNQSEKQTRVVRELEVIKKVERENELKPKAINKKSEMKAALGFSPDFFDMIIMREYLDYFFKESWSGDADYE